MYVHKLHKRRVQGIHYPNLGVVIPTKITQSARKLVAVLTKAFN